LAGASTARPIKLLNNIALELAKLDWSKHLNVTEDFVVYCVDLELRDLMKNLRKTVPRNVLAQLKRKGYI
jgi:hypothetical protein